MDDKTKKKIKRKIIGIGVYRLLSREKPRMQCNEFRFIIGCYAVKKKDWWMVLKELESEGVVRIAKNKRYINILMNADTIQWFNIIESRRKNI